jgi:hypothetical protein
VQAQRKALCEGGYKFLPVHAVSFSAATSCDICIAWWADFATIHSNVKRKISVTGKNKRLYQ